MVKKWRIMAKMAPILVIAVDSGINGMRQMIFTENCGVAKSVEIHSAQNAS